MDTLLNYIMYYIFVVYKQYTNVRHNNYNKMLGRYTMAQEDKFIVPQRKPAATVVSVRLPDTMLAKLEDVASKTGRSRNELVQMCIDYALARLEITEE